MINNINASLNKKVILLVEDISLVALTQKKILSRHNYKVIISPNGEEAIDILETNPEIDLILMDIDLGAGIDGTETAERIIKKHDIPIIFLSSHTEREIVEKTENISSYGYIVKDTGETVLIASIKMAFRLYESRKKEKESQRRIKIISENLPDTSIYQLITEPNQKFTFTYYSPNVQDVYGYSVEEVLNDASLLFNTVIDEDKEGWRKAVETALTNLGVFNHELRIRNRNGEIRWHQHIANLRVSGNAVIGDGIDIDITERKKSEEALIRAYKEKEDLLRELQHRAKNSFSMIAGMIFLAENSNNSPELNHILKELGSRVIAISDLYDLLYTNKDITNVRIDIYCTKIVNSLKLLSENISFDILFEPMTASFKTAAPVGIILTELITNSIKYAFPDQKKGVITIRLTGNSENAVLKVFDNGIGLPDKFQIGTTISLGLKLVTTLTDQINGRVKYENSEGTHFTVEFPLS